MIDIQNCSDRKPNREHQRVPFEVFGHPQQVLEESRLTTAEKRAVLAAWASDANAVPHLQALRQLPDGSIVKLEDIARSESVGRAGRARPEERILTLEATIQAPSNALTAMVATRALAG